MNEQVTTPAPEAGCLSRIGLAVIIGVAALPFFAVTALFPPWAKVRCQRQELLYVSKQVKVYERSFAGFDFIFSNQKWSRTSSPEVVGSGQLFDSTEYNVSWPVLNFEWALIIVVAVAVFVRRSRRLQFGVPSLPAARVNCGEIQFSIKLLPISQVGPNSERLGEITIGDFTERFACHSVFAGAEADAMEHHWHDALGRLVAGETPVALAHDPRFAWVFYREGQHCHIRQMLFLDSQFNPPSARETHSDEGSPISEWSIRIEDIQRFLSELQ